MQGMVGIQGPGIYPPPSHGSRGSCRKGHTYASALERIDDPDEEPADDLHSASVLAAWLAVGVADGVASEQDGVAGRTSEAERSAKCESCICVPPAFEGGIVPCLLLAALPGHGVATKFGIVGTGIKVKEHRYQSMDSDPK